MASIVSNQIGLCSATASWVGGVVPTENDKVTMNHDLTYDITSGIWGDDTATAIQLNAKLYISRSLNTKLTPKGQLVINSGGWLDRGTSADPIPAGIKSELVMNYSATMAAVKWGITMNSGNPGGKYTHVGATRAVKTSLVADPAALGSELAVNGGFVADTDWSKPAGVTISGGKANFASVANGLNLYQSGLTVGKYYQITFTISNFVVGGIKINYGAGLLTPIRQANGTYTEIFKAGYTNIYLQTSGTTTLSIDDVSVKEMQPSGNAGGNIIKVNDATGWSAGDDLYLGTSGLFGETEKIAIQSVSGNTITLASNLQYPHLPGVPIINSGGNCLTYAYNTSYQYYIQLAINTATHAANSIEIKYADFKDLAQNSGSIYYGLSLFSASVAPANIIKEISNTSFSRGTCALDFSTLCVDVPMDNLAFAGLSSAGINVRSGTIADLTNPCFIKNNIGIISSYSQGAALLKISNGIFNGNTSYAFNFTPVMGAEINDCQFDGNGNFMSGAQTGKITMNGAKINMGVGYPKSTTIFVGQTISALNIDMVDCQLKEGSYTNMNTNLTLGLSSDKISWINKNLDVTSQEIYTPNGIWTRDNTKYRNGNASLKLNTNSANVCSKSFKVPCKNGQTITIAGNIEHDAAFVAGTYTLPSMTISGLGITPVVFNASNSAGATQPYVKQATNNAGYDGEFTITFSATSNQSTGNVWFDGLVISPFVTSCRFYGYTEDPTNPLRTVDTFITSSYAVASAMTNISLNYATKVLTVTGDCTINDILDRTKYTDQLAANLAAPVTLTTKDGINYILAADWSFVVDGAEVDATGKTFKVTGTGTYSVINGGDFIGKLQDVVHTRVKIEAPNLVANTRVQIYNMTLDVEVDNSLIVTPGYTHIADIPTVDLVSGNTVRLRATQTDGVTAKKELEAFGILTTDGLLFIDEQEDCPVYNAIGIDGSTVGEFVDDYPHLQVDINDPDNVTSRQRLIAWWKYNLTTANGIRYFFGGITYEDINNYRINTSIVDLYLDNVNDTPLKFSDEARLYKDDGSTIVAPTSKTIHLDSGKVYDYNSEAILALLKKIKSEIE